MITGAMTLTGDTNLNKPGDATNVTDLLIDGFGHEEHANIVGEGLKSLQDDPSVQAAQGRLVERISNLPEYGKQSYTYEDSSEQFTANGLSRNWKQAAIEGNQAFRMVHGGEISATNIAVSENVTISTTWHIHDTFDFIPGTEHSEEYNKLATIIHLLYNDILGAKESFPTDAYWEEIIPTEPEEEDS